MTVSYITPIMDRTQLDVEYARVNQTDLINKNKGSWNYTDANRVCNNLKYAAEYMLEQGFLSKPYEMQLKTDWKETDIISYEQLNTMIVNNMNNLKSYSRSDLEWYTIPMIANMDYSLANYLERNIHMLATQEPIPPNTFELIVENGSGSGMYEARTVVTIQANAPETGMVFDHWSGDHLENIGQATAAVTTYEMPNENIKLKANYTGTIPHKLTIKTHSGIQEVNLMMGDVYNFTADPAPEDNKVFHHWEIEPSSTEDNLHEQAATTFITMPNEDMSLTAIYVTKGTKQLIVNYGSGSGWYEYDSYASISSNKPLDATFTSWSGDTQYLTGSVTQEYNSVRIPDKNQIVLTAHWTTPPIPPATNVLLKVVNGVITSTGKTEGTFTQGEQVSIKANSASEGFVFTGWEYSGGGVVNARWLPTTTVTIGSTATTVVAEYRELAYHNLTVITYSGTTTRTLETFDLFSVDANPIPDGYTFDKWTGDTYSFNVGLISGYAFDVNSVQTSTTMGESDRIITATYREIKSHVLTVKQRSGDITYTQKEFSTIRITAEDAPVGMRFVNWSLSGEGRVYTADLQTTTFEFGNGDAVLTPNYVNVWTVTVIDGTINGSESALLDEGEEYELKCRNRHIYEKWDGWTLDGQGTIHNLATTTTYFTVGHGNATITANISNYPDKTLTIYYRDPDTNEESLISQTTYTYGTYIPLIAPKAPDHTTFLSWEGDFEIIKAPLASSTYIENLTIDATIIATYYYPETPEYYTLTVYDGYPESGTYATGTQVTIRAKEPNQGWEFYKWYGDTQFLVNKEGLSNTENAIIMPAHSITLYAKFKVIGELPLYRVSVTGGTVKGTYTDSEGSIHKYGEDGSAVYIDVPAGTEITLTADPDTVGHTFSYWDGNFEQAGVTDIVTTNRVTTFVMTEYDINVTMNRRPINKTLIHSTNAISIGDVYPGTYTISGNLQDTDDYRYKFIHWTCVDANGNDRIDTVADPNSIETTITVTEEDEELWLTAEYTTYYHLIVIKGQDSENGYYYEGEEVNSVEADTPSPEERLMFDYWEDPMGIIENIYDPTPKIIMKDTVARIEAHFVSIDTTGNSIAVTGDALHEGIITRTESYLINGIFAVGTITFDRDGCIGVITQVDPDDNDDTDDYKVKKLFYGGNF